ncbi:S26 family signal peptidase [Sphingomonas sp. Leaf357]|uniref:signal peptidase I n=1 Tax=Sphingomonas sp. Leaf357 TaxID=1736350 RepID=UPI0006F7B6E6|nr:signal peptidase I [Sphingomonas sp. Leaf357]KQS03492.1 S26 family signal peptidase [Sphingomonas sp. Leaf357]
MSDTTTSGKTPAPAASAAKPKSETRETLTFLLKLALIVLIFRSFVFSPFSIPSESMLPRLLIGDYLFISKWNYGYSRWSLPFGVPLIPGRILARDPARGDVVVFRGPPGDDVDVIKRVIGLPGDTIQMRNGQLVLNGVAVPKERIADFILPISPNYPAGDDVNGKCDAAHLGVVEGKQICRYSRFRETLPGGRSYDVLDAANTPADNTGVYTVPAGRVFVMGDNRDNSADSRFPAPADAMPGEPVGMGYVPMERIQGKAVVGFFSTDGSASWLLPWTWFTAARWSRIGEGF